MSGDADSASEHAKREAVTQAVAIAGAVVLVLVASWQRKMSEPDYFRLRRMRAAKAGERAFARAAAWSWAHAERARVAYERERDAP